MIPNASPAPLTGAKVRVDRVAPQSLSLGGAVFPSLGPARGARPNLSQGGAVLRSLSQGTAAVFRLPSLSPGGAVLRSLVLAGAACRSLVLAGAACLSLFLLAGVAFLSLVLVGAAFLSLVLGGVVLLSLSPHSAGPWSLAVGGLAGRVGAGTDGPAGWRLGSRASLAGRPPWWRWAYSPATDQRTSW